METSEQPIEDTFAMQRQYEWLRARFEPRKEAISGGLNEIAKALAAAQCEMHNPAFDSQNPHFKNKFASLAAVRNAVVPVLAKHGISLTQDLTTVENGVACRTILTHSSGQQMIFGPLVMPVPSGANSQQLGSAGSYCKRYAMMAVGAIVGDTDDDAEAAVGRDKVNGLPRIDPMGENATKAPSTLAKLIASNFQAAWDMKSSEQVVTTHDTANQTPDDYQQAWKLLAAPVRKGIKDMLSAAKNGATQQ
jgi:hypothetical protein